MAFDLVQYFADQIKIQKPSLLNNHDQTKRCQYLEEINILSLGKLITLWKNDDHKVYQEIKNPDPLYIQEVARHLTTSAQNQSELNLSELERATSEVFELQLHELKQLDETGGFGSSGIQELLLGQIEHLSGQADDWVWNTNQLTELLGSKPVAHEVVSLESTIKEFNQMVHQAKSEENLHLDAEADTIALPTPTWSKWVAPIVALSLLLFLYSSYCQLVNA